MATRLTAPLYQVIDATGSPGNGWKLYFYETGTTTLKDTYSDEALSVANDNPIIADANGRFGDIFGVSKEEYKVILKDADDNTIVTEDPVDTISYNINSFGTRPAQHWGTTTNTADAYQIKPVPSITAYTDDLLFSFTPHLDNNADCTFAVFEEGTISTYLSALTMKKYNGAGAKVNLKASDLEAGQTYIACIDTTNVVVLNPESLVSLTIDSLTVDEILGLNASLTARGISYLPSKISISNNVTDANNDINFGVGTAVADDASIDIFLPSSITKKLDASFAEGTNQGGLDTGSKASNTKYDCYVIAKNDGTSDALFTVSGSAPTMPSGFTKSKYRGFIKTDGSSNIIQFTQMGTYFFFKAPQHDLAYTSSTTPTNRNTSLTNNVIGIFSVSLNTTGSANTTYVYDVNGTDGTVGFGSFVSAVCSPGGFGSAQIMVKVSETGQIRTKEQSNTISTVNIDVIGWYDTRIENDIN